MKKLHLSSFSFFSSCHLLISCLHISCVSILIVAACIWEDFFLIVVLSLACIYIQHFVLPCYGTIVSLSGLIQVILAMIKIVFKLFLEKHLVSITYSFVFIKSLTLFLRFRLNLSNSWSMLRLWTRWWSICDFFVRLKQFLSVVSLNEKVDTLMRLISCLFISISSLAEAWRYDVLGLSIL